MARRGWLDTVEGALTNPSRFFSKEPIEGGYPRSVEFAAINFIVYAVLFSITYSAFAPFTSSVTGALRFLINPGATAVMTSALATPLIQNIVLYMGWTLVTLLVNGLITFTVARALKGSGTLEETVRVFSYASAASLFAWIPYVTVAASLYSFYIGVVGVSYMHGFSRTKAALVAALGILPITAVDYLLVYRAGLL
ncbi:MAG: YIP1 family protein [Candidatus Aenigmarchaeota archaeon]|nr:YIP1 family protein [Candidatus Aenigmarchaeota archaeon]